MRAAVVSIERWALTTSFYGLPKIDYRRLLCACLMSWMGWVEVAGYVVSKRKAKARGVAADVTAARHPTSALRWPLRLTSSARRRVRNAKAHLVCFPLCVLPFRNRALPFVCCRADASQSTVTKHPWPVFVSHRDNLGLPWAKWIMSQDSQVVCTTVPSLSKTNVALNKS